MGGFVWQWKAHGVLYGGGGYKYGGDFGESHNDKNICLNGLTGPNLEIRPALLNLKKIYGNEKIKNEKIETPSVILSSTKKTCKTALSGKTMAIICDETEYRVNLFTGELFSVIIDGSEKLKAPVTVNITRAFIDNDTPVKAAWLNRGIYDAKPVIQTVKSGKNMLKFTGKMLPYFRESCLDFSLEYKFHSNGIKVNFSYTTLIKNMPRIGLTFAVDKNMNKLEFYGKGPYETYMDTAALNAFGYYKTTVKKDFTNYIFPQECGSHCCTEYLKLSGRNNIVISASKPFSFSALPYDEKTLRETTHNWKLPPQKAVYVSIDVAMRGIGSGSCNSVGLNEKYEIPCNGGNTFVIKFQH